MMSWASITLFLQTYQSEVIICSWGILGLGLAQNLMYATQLVLAFREFSRMRLHTQQANDFWLLASDLTMPISILIPAYNEEVTIVDSVRATLTTHYPNFEVIVINDGSADSTLKSLIDAFDLRASDRMYEPRLDHKPIRTIYASADHPNLVVVDKENGGRSDALNAGLDIARTPLFCTLDADSILDPTALLKTVQPFVERPEKVVATGGTVRILNGCTMEKGVVKHVTLPKKLLPLFQTIEYIRAFLMGRMAWSHVGILTIISGAFSIFRRDLAVEVGGFNTKTIGEDFELVMRLHRYCLEQKRPYEMCFVPEPVCWTEVPESWRVIRSQRIRWQQGALEVFFAQKNMLLNPRYGRIGMVAMPIIFLIDVVGPLAELLGYLLLPAFYILGALNLGFILAFVALFFVFGIFISTMSLVLEEISLQRFKDIRSMLMLLGAAVLENFGYRQYNNIWRMIGWWRFIRRKQVWGTMTRVGMKK